MAAPQRLNYFCCQLAVPNGHAAASSLWTLIQSYFTTNRPLDLPNIFPSAKSYDLQAASTSSQNVIVSDYAASSTAPGLNLATAIGVELVPTGNIYQPPASDTLSHDLQAVWLYSNGSGGLVNVQVRC